LKRGNSNLFDRNEERFEVSFIKTRYEVTQNEIMEMQKEMGCFHFEEISSVLKKDGNVDETFAFIAKHLSKTNNKLSKSNLDESMSPLI